MRTTQHTSTSKNGQKNSHFADQSGGKELENEAVDKMQPVVKQHAAGSNGLASPPPPPIEGIDFNSLNIMPVEQRGLQPKLRGNAPDDKYEKEADSVADQVIRMSLAKPAKGLSPFVKPLVQTRLQEQGSGLLPGPKIAQYIKSAGGGAPLSKDVREFMEQRIGADFSAVRIHTGIKADNLNRQLNARAFTVGQDVFFGANNYQPHTTEGKRLLAHELAHTVQQRESKGAIQRDKNPNKPDRTIIEPSGDKKEDIEKLQELHGSPLKYILYATVNQLLVYDSTKNLKARYPISLKEGIWYGFFSPFQQGWSVWSSVGKQTVPLIKPNLKSLSKKDREIVSNLDSSLVIKDWFTSEKHFKHYLNLTKIDKGTAVGLIVNLGGGSKKAKVPPKPDWAKMLEKRVRKLIAEVKEKGEPFPKDLPDKFLIYYSQDFLKWRIRVRQVTATKKEKLRVYMSVPDQQDAEKVLTAARRAIRLHKSQDEHRQDRSKEKTLPPDKRWALYLRNRLMARLKKDRAKFPDSFHWRDKLTLTLIEGEVYLRAWVWKEQKDREGKDSSVFVKGVLPNPLKKADKEEVIYQRLLKLVMVLRKPVKTPVKLKKSDEELKLKRVMRSYPARILPQNMRKDSITITKGEVEFFAALDYGRYNHTLLNQTLAAMQNVSFKWAIYPIKPNEQLNEQERKRMPKDWSKLRTWLSPKYQTLADIKNTQPVMMTEWGHSAFVKLKMPSQPGDYVVYMYAQVGDHTSDDGKVTRRIPSEAFLPVRIKTGYSLSEEVSNASLREQQSLENRLLTDKKLKEKDKLAIQGRIKEIKRVERLSLFDSLTEKKSLVERKQRDLKTLHSLVRTRGSTPILLKIDQSKVSSDAKKRLTSLVVELKLGYPGSSLIASITNALATLKRQAGSLVKIENQAKEYRNNFKPNPSKSGGLPHVHIPIAAFASGVTGHTYPLVMMIGESKASAGNGNFTYSLVDLTNPTKSKIYEGTGKTRAKAIHEAFLDFARWNDYGTGSLSYRVPGLVEGGRVENRPGTGKQVVTALKWASAAVGAVALLLVVAGTGGTAAGVIGAVAAVSGVGFAINNIRERSVNHRLKADAELALDLIDIIGSLAIVGSVIVRSASQAAKAASAAGKVAQAANITAKVKMASNALLFYDIAELGATTIAMSYKVSADLATIKNSHLPKSRREALKMEIILNGMLSGAILTLGAVRTVGDVGSLITSSAGNKYDAANKRAGITDATGDWSPAVKKDGDLPPRKTGDQTPDVPKDVRRRVDDNSEPSQAATKRGETLDNPVRPEDPDYHRLQVGDSKFYLDKSGSRGYVEKPSSDTVFLRTELGQTTGKNIHNRELRGLLDGLPISSSKNGSKSGFQILHALGKVVGHESPFGLMLGSWTLNNVYQTSSNWVKSNSTGRWYPKAMSGIEVFISNLAKNAKPNTKLFLELTVKGVPGNTGKTRGKEFLKEITYRVKSHGPATNGWTQSTSGNTVFELSLQVRKPHDPDSKIDIIPTHFNVDNMRNYVSLDFLPGPRLRQTKSGGDPPAGDANKKGTTINSLPADNRASSVTPGNSPSTANKPSSNKGGTNTGKKPLFAKQTVTYDPLLPKGQGFTDKYGNVTISSKGSQNDRDLVRYHESVHAALSPKFKFLRDFRANLGVAAYKNSSLVRYIEEALAETYAQLKVNGIRNMPEGLRFPIKNGYVTITNVAAEGALALFLFAGITYGLHLTINSESDQQKP